MATTNELRALIQARLPDNISREIDAKDVRDLLDYIGDIIDGRPPISVDDLPPELTDLLDTVQTEVAIPSGLTATSILLADGRARVDITWRAAANAVSYQVEIREGSLNPLVRAAPDMRFSFETFPGTVVEARVRGVNALGDFGEWSPFESVIAAVDNVAPATPQNVRADPSFESIWLRWDDNSERDLSHYEIEGFGRAAANVVLVDNLEADTDYTFRVRAVDSSGNESPWSDPPVTARTISVSNRIQSEIDNATWATDLGFIRPWDGAELPTNHVGDTISWNGKLWTWNGTEYVSAADFGDISFEDIQGELGLGQIGQDLENLILSQGASADDAVAAAEAARDAALDAQGGAEAAQGVAEAAAGLAQGARDDAQSAAGAAETARDDALTAQGVAEGAATAAAGSASNASASETAAGQSASAADASAVQANTSAGQAQSYRDQAAVSETNAAGSASSAAQSAGVAASTLTDAQKLINSARTMLPTIPTIEAAAFSISGNGTPPVGEESYGSDEEGPYVARSAATAVIYTRGSVPAGDSRVYRVTAKFSLAQEATARFQVVYRNAGDTESIASGSPAPETLPAGVHTKTMIIGRYAGGLVDTVNGGTNWVNAGSIRFGATALYDPVAQFKLYELKIEDLTEADLAARQAGLAEGSASAAATSASTAAASETAAGQSASAAQTARTQAETARGQAQTFRDEAAVSKQDAEGAAALATSSAGIATDAANDAGDHASAAAGSASVAESHADDAGQRASAAEASRLAAETARGQAQTFRNEAASARQDAEGAAATASTQAGIATDAANDAGDHASAAAGSASTAESHADDAGQHATAAAASATQAATDRAQAGTFRDEASAAKEDAEGAAASAATSAGVAASARDEAIGAVVNTVLPSRFAEGLQFWTHNRVGSPETISGTNYMAFIPDDPVFGESLLWTVTPTAAGGNVLPRGVVSWGDGRAYRVTITFRVLETTHNDGQADLRIQYVGLDDLYQNPDIVAGGGGLFPADGSVQTMSAVFSDVQREGIDVARTIPRTWARFGIRNQRVDQSPTVVIQRIQIDDVTQVIDAGVAASAAATSAATAAARADDAGQHASAAQTARTQAETARGQAQTFAGEASTSATNAAGSANTATQQAGLAATSANDAGQSATAASQSATTATTKATEAGTSASTASTHASTAQTQAGIATTKAGEAVLSADAAAGSAVQASSYAQLASLALSGGMARNPTFSNWTGQWPAQMSVVPGSNGTASKVAGKYGNALQLDVTGTAATGPYVTMQNTPHLNGNMNPDKVLVTVELEVTSGDPAGLELQAAWYQGSTWRWVRKLIGPKLAVGSGIQTYQAVFDKPAAAVSPTSFLIRVNSSTTTAGGSYSECTVVLHRMDVAEVVADSFVDEQRQTKATVDGLAESAYVLRVKAGGASAGLEVVAADDPVSGPASSIRMSADEIIMDGTVKAPQIAAGEITVNHLAVGDITNLFAGYDDPDTCPFIPQDNTANWNATVGYAGQKSLVVSSTGQIAKYALGKVSVNPGEQYYIAFYAARNVAWDGQANNSKLRFGDQNNGHIMSLPFDAASIPHFTTGYELKELTLTVPEGVNALNISINKDATEGMAYLSGMVMRKMDNGKLIVNGSITATHLIQTDEVITNTSQIKEAIIKEAHISGTLNANIIRAGTTLSGSILVGGNTLSSVNSNAALGAQNPVSRINSGTTNIDPGRIQISGSTTLSAWRGLQDTTAINGGVIETESIFARSLKLGDTSNLIVNGDMTDVSNPVDTYFSFQGNTNAFWQGAAQNSGTHSLQINRNASTETRFAANPAYFIPVSAGEEFACQIWQWVNATSLNGLYFRVRWHDASKAFISHSDAISNDSSGVGWHLREGSVTAPANAAFAQVQVWQNNGNSTTTAWRIDRIIFRRKTGTINISDGVITGPKLDMESVLADIAEFDQAFINDAHILGLLSARHIDMSGLNTGFKVNKQSLEDDSSGLFFGTGSSLNEFGFYLSRYSPTGSPQSLKVSDKGVSLLNAQHYLIGGEFTPHHMVTESQTINLPTGTSLLTMTLVGGGGGGSGHDGTRQAPGHNGEPTTVTLMDGTTQVHQWIAAGGLGADNITGIGAEGRDGEDSILGRGGRAGLSGDNGGSTGVRGGGGRSVSYKGGGAGGGVKVEDYDISGLSNPRLIITIGAGGAGAPRGFAGGNGAVKYRTAIETSTRADVLPLIPTATGSFSKPSNATGANVFPALGPGMWNIFTTDASNLDIGQVRITSRGHEVNLWMGSVATFIADQRPNILTGIGQHRTIHFNFYRMGNWG